MQALVATALGFSGASPVDVGYVAVHGTGTPLGDPIEVGALGAALAGKGASGAGYMAPSLGSVKACYGHTEGAAGVTGEVFAKLPRHKARIALELHPIFTPLVSSCSERPSD